jgi:hypothetical protein
MAKSSTELPVRDTESLSSVYRQRLNALSIGTITGLTSKTETNLWDWPLFNYLLQDLRSKMETESSQIKERLEEEDRKRRAEAASLADKIEREKAELQRRLNEV